MPGRSSNSANPNDNYKFTGHERDDEAGMTMYHANARGYDPILGRFMQIDPMSHLYPSMSPFTYVLNNPLSYIDPTGETVKCSTQEECQKAADDFNTVVEGAGVTVTEYEYEVSAAKWWNPKTWGDKKTATGYQLSTGESDYDFSQSEEAGALFDVINTDEVEYWAVYESDDFSPRGTGLTLFNLGAGLVAGKSGLPIFMAKWGFNRYNASYNNGKKEPSVSAKAQSIGWKMGNAIYKKI